MQGTEPPDRLCRICNITYTILIITGNAFTRMSSIPAGAYPVRSVENFTWRVCVIQKFQALARSCRTIPNGTEAPGLSTGIVVHYAFAFLEEDIPYIPEIICEKMKQKRVAEKQCTYQYQ